MKTLFSVCWYSVVLAFSPVVNAETQLPREAAFWQQVVADSSPVEIAMTMQNSTIPWPQVAASKSAPTWQINLVTQLHRIIRQSFDLSAPKNTDDVKAYLRIAKELKNASGYSNILLADTLYRLVIFRAAQELSLSFDNREQVESFVNELPSPSLGIKERLVLFAKDDPSLAQQMSTIDKIDSSDNFYVISRRLLVKDSAESGRFDTGELTFSHLMTNPSGLGVTFRIAQTEMLTAICLKSLLTFIKRGGSSSELDPTDITKFKKRMSDAKDEYEYPAFGVRRLSVYHLLSVLELSSSQNVRQAFLRIALE